MFKGLRRNSSTNGRKQTSPTLPTLPAVDGKSSIGTSDYARQCHKIMELYWSIRDLQVDAVFDIPRVVVIGGQSSGKSSLVEAVSGITVPRDSGTCTRCPMDCSMSSDAKSWSCTVSLSREFDREGNRYPIPTIEPFGPVIDDRSSLELWIRRAQSANLSPHRPMSDFYTMTEFDLKNNPDPEILPFSKNAVHIRLKDPNTTDLTFVDMPGLIQNAEGTTISLIRNLVESYIEMPNTLIVVAMPMTDDIENMQALAIAKDPKVDPHKLRTIGVLTKPDTLGEGSRGRRNAWRKLLEGKGGEHHAKHGYFCVRLPHDDERARAITKLEAERIASQFFDTTEPWCLIADRGRFGIPNFVRDISKLLIELIEKNLPGLHDGVESELEKTLFDLDSLPAISTNDPTTEIMLCIQRFCKAATSEGQHEAAQLEFIQDNRYRYSIFKQEIEMTTPNFHPFENVHPISSRMNVESQCEPRALSDIREIIKKSVAWELPGNIPYSATETLVLQYTTLWRDPSLRCFDDVVSNSRKLLNALLCKYFGRYKDLEKYLRGLVFLEHDIHVQKTRLVIERLLEFETTPLYTNLSDVYMQEKNTWISKYKGMRKTYLSTARPEPPRTHLPTARPEPFRASLSDIEYDSPSQPLPILYWFPSPTPIDRPAASTTEDEINLIAGVQAYFQVAHKRLVDYIPLTIEHELNQAFGNSIHQTLLNAFAKGVQSDEVDMNDLVREDPVIARRRKELNDRKSRLIQMKEKLDKFHLDGK